MHQYYYSAEVILWEYIYYMQKYGQTYTRNEKLHHQLLYNLTKLSVPLDPANTDYQAIQEWVAEGNTIAEAD